MKNVYRILWTTNLWSQYNASGPSIIIMYESLFKYYQKVHTLLYEDAGWDVHDWKKTFKLISKKLPVFL